MSDEAASPGWDAITAQCSRLYGEQEPKHWGTLIPAHLGGKDPLHGISAYRSTRGGRPHWHIITYGLTDLWGTDGKSEDVSGFGIELTFRLPCTANEETPPAWSLNFLQNIARYITTTGRVLEIGHHVNCNGPISLESPTKIEAICCVTDPELSDLVHAPHGYFKFVQIYGITLPELAEIVAWETESVVKMMQARDELLVTDLARDDFFGDAALLNAILLESGRNPSKTGILYTTPLSTSVAGFLRKRRRITFGAILVKQMLRLVPKRLGFGLPLTLFAEQRQITLLSENSNESPSADHTTEVIVLNKTEQLALTSTVRENAGIYRLSPRLDIEVVRSEIKDNQGKIVSVIG